jgi:hypothetical protein
MRELNTEKASMRELEAEEVALVSGGDFLGWLSGVLSSGQDTAIPANNAGLGIRG